MPGVPTPHFNQDSEEVLALPGSTCSSSSLQLLVALFVFWFPKARHAKKIWIFKWSELSGHFMIILLNRTEI